MLFQTCTKLTFGVSDVFVVTVIARNRINGVGSLFFHDRILRFGENMPLSLKRVLSNFNVVAIQNPLGNSCLRKLQCVKSTAAQIESPSFSCY